MKKFFIALAIFFLIGLANAAYVTVETDQNASVACYIVEGCDLVLNSSYAKLLGIHLSLWGIAYYVVGLLLLALLYRQKLSSALFLAYAAAGLAVSLVLLYIQGLVLRAFCSSCILSAAVTLGILACATLLYRRHQKISRDSVS
jgi:uncharacterized membrane protein